MAFYSDFAGHYEKVFPYREAVFAFLDGRLPKSGRVLDIGCGTGGYCGRLAENGRPCLGIDLDPGMIEAAQAAHIESESCRYRILDMNSIDSLPAGEFGGVFCLGNVLPHLPAGELPSFLRKVHDLLAPGGVWILQTVNFDALLDRDRYDFPVLEIPGESLHFYRSYVDIRDHSLVFTTHLVQGGRRVFAGEATLYPMRARGYVAVHRAAGFALSEHYADYVGGGFDPGVPSGNVMVFNK